MNREFEESKEILDRHLAQETEVSPADLADHLKIIKRYDEDEYSNYLKQLDYENLGEIAIELPDHMLKDIIEDLPEDKIVKAIENLDSDDATDLLQNIEDIDEDKAKELFDSLEIDSQKEISKLITYEENEAGAYMQVELFSANLDEKLDVAIKRFRKMKKTGEIDNIYQLFVVDKNNVLRYALPIDDLLLFDFDDTLKEAISKNRDEYKPHTALDTDDIAQIAQMVKDYDLSAVAVVNKAGVLLGRITVDDIHDFLEESATEQIYNLAGVDDEAENEDTIIKAGRSRALWLFVNLITAIIASTIIGLFDQTIEKFVALAVLMPIVASMGGNTGTQALTVTVRKLALGNIDFINAKSVILREIGISLSNGFIFAFIMGVVAYFWFQMPLLGLVIAISMFINLSLAGFFGAVIPITLKKLSIDPAVGSSVLLTTMTDIVGFFSFLGVARWVLM